MGTLISLLLSKFGAVLATVGAFFALWIGYKYQKGRADKAVEAAEHAGQVIEVYKNDRATDEEISNEKTRIESAPVDTWDLDDELLRLRRASEGGNAPAGAGPDDK